MASHSNARNRSVRPEPSAVVAHATPAAAEESVLRATAKSERSDSPLLALEARFPRPDVGQNEALKAAIYYALQSRISEFLEAHSNDAQRESVPLDDRDLRPANVIKSDATTKLSLMLDFIYKYRPEHCEDLGKVIQNLESVRHSAFCAVPRESIYELLKLFRSYSQDRASEIEAISDEHSADGAPANTLALSLEDANSIQKCAMMIQAVEHAVGYLLDVLLRADRNDLSE